jgi:hypothetical protein
MWLLLFVRNYAGLFSLVPTPAAGSGDGGDIPHPVKGPCWPLGTPLQSSYVSSFIHFIMFS